MDCKSCKNCAYILVSSERCDDCDKLYSNWESPYAILKRLEAAEAKLKQIEEWAETPSGIQNYEHLAGYDHAQFHVREILRGETCQN
jgi:hypothetical protein